MLNIKEVIRVVNTVIGKNSKKYYNSTVVKSTNKPNYNNGINQPKICAINHQLCKEFYSDNSEKDIWNIRCPFGFTVSKKSFNTSTNYGKISIFSIIAFSKSSNINQLLANLPRKLKPLKGEILEELNSLTLNEKEHKQNRSYINGLMETLLIGRIGLSIQSISHQFFTPLQGAMSDVKNIENNTDIDASIKRLSKNFTSLNKLATEIQLILSTSEDFNFNMLRRVTIHIMINEIFDSLLASAEEKKIELNQSYNNFSKSVDAIPNQLYIVISNIISNAIKYSYSGILDIPLEVKVQYDMKDGEYLLIKVINEGCKITDEEIQDRLIFNLAYRGLYSGDRQRTGSGSGLFIANEITKLHGGKIDVSSDFCGGNINQETDRYKNIFTISWPIIIE